MGIISEEEESSQEEDESVNQLQKDVLTVQEQVATSSYVHTGESFWIRNIYPGTGGQWKYLFKLSHQ